MAATSSSQTQSATRPTVRWRSIALPTEHGGWGFLLEPILLGLLLGPSWRGVLLGISAISFFLVHQPLKIALKDRVKGRQVARTRYAERFVAGYAATALLAFSLVALTAGDLTFVIPLGIVAPLAFVQLLHEAQNRGRALLPQMSGAVALSASAPAMLLVDGWAFDEALAVGVLLAIRAISAIFYVRTRLRLEYDRSPNLTPAWLSHLATLVTTAGLIVAKLVPAGAIVAFIILSGRALVGISPYRQPAKPSQIGLREMAFGFLTTIIIAVSYAV
jgi:hypothetical protein